MKETLVYVVWVEWPSGDWEFVAVYSSQEAAEASVHRGKTSGSGGRYFWTLVPSDEGVAG